MPEEEETRRRRAVLALLGLLAWASRLLPVGNFLEIHRQAIQTAPGRAADWARRKIQKVVSFLRQHGTAFAASFLGVAALAILFGTMAILQDIAPEPSRGPTASVPSPTGSGPSSPPPSSSGSPIVIPSPSSTSGSGSSLEPGATATPSSSRSPRPTSTPSPSRTPGPRPSSSTPSPSKSPGPTPSGSLPTPSPRPTPSSTPSPSTPAPTEPPSPSPRPTPTQTAGPSSSPPVGSGRPHDCRHAPKCHKPPKTGASEMSIALGIIPFAFAVVAGFVVRRKVR